MRHQHSEPRQQPKQEPHGRQPADAQSDREERSHHADVGVAPGQDDDQTIDQNQAVEEGPTRRNPAPRMEPPREDSRTDQRSAPAQPSKNRHDRNNKKT